MRTGVAPLRFFPGYPTFVVSNASGKLLALRDGTNVTTAGLISWIRAL